MKKIHIKHLTIRLWIACFVLFSAGLSFAQTSHYSQYYTSELALSPCFAARESHITVGLNSRTQWANVVPYQANQASMILPIYYKKKRVSNIAGVGLNFFSNDAGQVNVKTSGFALSAAYNQPLTRNDLHHLYFGLQGGLIQRSTGTGSIQTGNQYNSNVGFDESMSSGISSVAANVSGLNLAGGLSYYFNPDKDYRKSDWSGALGVSAYHLNGVDLSVIDGQEDVLETLVNVYGSVTMHLSGRLYVKPHFLWTKQGASNLTIAGAYVNYVILDNHTMIVPNTVQLGAVYRVNDAFVPVVGIGNEFYKLGLSYDWSASLGKALLLQRANTFELSLQIAFYHPNKDESLITQPRYRKN